MYNNESYMYAEVSVLLWIMHSSATLKRNGTERIFFFGVHM